MIRLCNEKANALKHELQRERKKREDDEEQTENEFNQQIQILKEEIEEEKRVREEITNELVTTLGDEVLKL